MPLAPVRATLGKPKLRAVSPKAAEPSKPKLVAYGKEGVGKTWFSLQFPSVYFIDVEGGANRSHYTSILDQSGGVYLGPNEGANDFEVVIEQVMALASERHSYKTLVIDSVTKLYNSAIANETERLAIAGIKNEFGADKKPAAQYARRLVNWLQRIDMNVILIAHQTDIWGLDDRGQRAALGVGPDCWAKLPYELDLCVNVMKQGNRRLGKIGKSRLLGFKEGDVFDFTYPEFASRYGTDVIESDSKPIALAAAEQVEEIKRLIGAVKLPEGQVEKWLSAASAESWAEVEAEKVVKYIEYLKGRIAA